MNMRALVVSLAVSAALAGCANGTAEIATATDPGPDVSTGTWMNESGEPAQRGSGADSSYEVASFLMPSHCE